MLTLRAQALSGVLLSSILLLAGCGEERIEPSGHNVLLIAVDTLRADHLGVYGYQRATSPNLDDLASEGLVFESVQAPRAKTTPSVATLLTGLYPHDHGVRDLTQELAAEVATLPESLAAAGYRTAAIIGNFVLQRRLSGLDRGFTTWIEELPDRQGVPPDDVPERRAGSLTDGALELLESELLGSDEPWFLYLHYMDPHGLYEPPAEHDRFLAGEPRYIEEPRPGEGRLRVASYNVPADAWSAGRIDAARVIDRYDGEIAHVDAQLGRLLDELRGRGVLEDTWVIVTADHGESLGEHDYWFEHGLYAYQATCHVPLIVHPPLSLEGRGAGERRTSVLSLADVAPTLAAWLGIPFTPSAGREVPGDTLTGRASPELLLRELTRPRAAFGEKVESASVEGAVRTKTVRLGRLKLVQRFVPGAQGTRIEEELYDVLADPAEARNLLEEEDSHDALVLEAMRAELEAFLGLDDGFEELAQTLARRRAELESRDPAAARSLEALGYR